MPKQENTEWNDKMNDALKEAMEQPQDWGKIPYLKTKSITFDKEAQDNLPQWVKDKMKADRVNARLKPKH